MKLSGVRFAIGMSTLAVLFSACGPSEKEPDAAETTVSTPSTVVNAMPDPGTVTGDTIHIGGRYVVFFVAPAVAGSDSTALQQFESDAMLLLDSLSRATGIKGSFTHVTNIRIRNQGKSAMTISTPALHTEAGLLLTDGQQPPKIHKGVHDAATCRQFISNYFFLDSK